MSALFESVNKCETQIFDCTTPVVGTSSISTINGGEYSGYYPSWYNGSTTVPSTTTTPFIESGIYGGHNDVVISGVSGRFPENLEEFSQKLFSGIGYESVYPRQTTTGVYGGYPRTNGVFDPTYFGIDMKEAECIDSRMKQLVEVAYEAIFDSGLNPIEFRGSKTGVFVGLTTDSGYQTITTPTTQYATKLASYFDFKGPSCTMDITNSSGLVALEQAFTAIKTGLCDHAIVCGWSIPTTTSTPYGIEKIEVQPIEGGLSVVFLQKRDISRRFYSKILLSKIFGGEIMGRGDTEFLTRYLRDLYTESSIDPSRVGYVESYGPKMFGGIMNECKTFCDVYTHPSTTGIRSTPLLIGTTRSTIDDNVESSTYGLMALVKMLVSIQRGVMPASIFSKHEDIMPMVEDRIKLLNVNTKLPVGLMALNSFGYSGRNVHLVLEPNTNYVINKSGQSSSFWNQDLTEMCRQPRLFNFSSTTEEGLTRVFEQMHKYPTDLATHFLLHPNAMTTPITHPYRGFTILNANNPIREVKKVVSEKRPLFFVFNGVGTQWVGMGKDLMQVEYFRNSMLRIAEVLKPYGVDLISLIKGDKIYDRTLHTMLSIVAIQIALVDCLKVLGVEADGLIGYSFSELVAAYCDGCLTLEEAILAAMYHGKIVEESNLTRGSMATIGLTWDECLRECPSSIVPVIHYASDLVTVSGPKREIQQFVEQMRSRGIFAKEIETTGAAFHSYLMTPIVPALRSALEKVIRTPRLRSSKWISTSFPEQKWDTDMCKYFSVEHYLNNVVSPCYFREAIRRVPTNAVVIEIAPHSFMQPIFVKNMCDKLTYINLMKRDVPSSVEHFWYSLGRLYNEGINIDTIKLFSSYPNREQAYYPVPVSTRFLSPFSATTSITTPITTSYPIQRSGDSFVGQSYTSTAECPFSKSYTYEIDITRDSEFNFIGGYKLDGQVVLPTSGYLYLVWKSLAAMRNVSINELPVVFEHVKFHCPTVFTTEKIVLTVSFVHLSGRKFEIYENRKIVACGHVYVPEHLSVSSTIDMPEWSTSSMWSRSSTISNTIDLLEQDEIYKELRLRGYEFSNEFKGIVKSSVDGTKGEIMWTGKWIPFLESIFQMYCLSVRGLQIPSSIVSIKIDPRIQKVRLLDSNNNITASFYQQQQQCRSMNSIVDTVRDYTYGGMPITSNNFVAGDYTTIPCVFDPYTKCFVAGGVEVCGVSTASLPKFALSSSIFAHQPTVFERVSFVPYFEKRGIDEEYSYPEGEFRQKYELMDNYLNELKFHLGNTLRRLEYPSTYVPTTSTTYRKPEYTTEKLMDGHLLKLFSEISKIECDSQFIYKVKQMLMDKFSYYNALHQDTVFNHINNRHAYLKSFLDTVLENVSCTTRPVIRILEIAPSMSSFGVKVNKFLATHPLVTIDYHYVPIGDLSEDLYTEWNRTSVFPINKVDWNLRTQDMPVHLKDFDLVMFNGSIGSLPFFEDKLMLKKWLQTVCERVLTPKGFLFAHEYTNNFEILNYLQRLEHIIYGQKTKEFQSYKYQTEGEWRRLFEEIGYSPIGLKSDSILSSMFLYRKPCINTPMISSYLPTSSILTTPRDIEIIINEIDCFKWIEKVKSAMSDSTVDRIWLINDRVPTSGLIGMVNCLRKEVRGDRIRCVFIADTKPTTISTVQPWTAHYEQLKKADLLMNVYKNGKWGSYRHLIDDIEQPIFKDNVRHAYVNWMKSGDVSTLNWMQSAEPSVVNGLSKGLFNVSYAGINYRDILLASGKILPEHVATYNGVSDHVFGMEFSGIAKNKRYMGVTPYKGLATTVTADWKYCWEVPQEWSLEQAATVPLAYATAYYSLIVKGGLRRGETVFVHSGATPIGQAAIAIALQHDCRVLVSVETAERRQFLLSLFGGRLNEENFTGIEDVMYEKHIMNMTKCFGVDVVFNTLPMITVTPSLIRVCKPTGRFLDIGRYETSNVLTSSILKNIIYNNIAVETLFDDGCQDWMKVYNLVQEGIRMGVVRPLRSIVFDRYKVQDAFKQLIQEKIFGKVLIKVWEPKEFSTPLTISALPKVWFSPYLSYVITEGLSTVGLELAQWMVTKGARKIVLTSRSGVRTNYQTKRIHYLQEFYGAIVTISNYDVKDEGECILLIKDATALSEERRIGGIFYLPTVYEDGMIDVMTPEKYKRMLEARYLGACHLDKYSRGMDDCKFVVFSTLSSGRGYPGHSSFGYADSAIERLVEQRRNEGRHAVAIQWGTISDNFMTVNGTLPQKMHSCLTTLEKVLLNGERSAIWSSHVPTIRTTTVVPSFESTYGTSTYPINVPSIYQSVPTTIYTSSMPTSTSYPSLTSTIVPTVYETLVRLMGVRGESIRHISMEKTLIDLGVTMSMVNELKQLLETYYKIYMSEREIQLMTIEKLKAIDETRSYMKEYRTNGISGGRVLPKFNYLMPRRVFERLNNVESTISQVPVVIIHPIEGHVNMLKNWAKYMKFPVYGVQFTSDALKCETIEQLAEYYWSQLDQEFKTMGGKFHLMGYSYGAQVAYEMAAKKCNRIATLTFLDGCHTYINSILTPTRTKMFQFQNTPDIESELLHSFVSQYTQMPNRAQFINYLMSLSCLEERIKCAVKELNTSQFTFDSVDVELAARSYIKKMIMSYKYQPTMPVRLNEIFLVKPTIRSEYVKVFGEDYGLGSVFNGKIRTHVVDGDQRTFLEAGNGYKVATILNDYFMQYF